MTELDTDALQTLMRGDDDDFVRWDAAQTLLAHSIESRIGDNAAIDQRVVDACEAILASDMDNAMKAHTLRLPSEDYLADRAAVKGLVDVQSLHAARDGIKRDLAGALTSHWRQRVEDLAESATYAPEGDQIGRRSLRHVALDYLCYADADAVELAEALYRQANNLTDRLAGARLVMQFGSAERRQALLDDFYRQWSGQALVVNQWLSLQATRPSEDAVDDVSTLLEHPAFDWRNPNKLRALVGAFASANAIAFHRPDGAGYRLLTDTVVRIQADNPQIASRMLGPLTRWKRYASGQALMREQLQRVADLDDLSRDVFEVVNRSLAE
jgi:aminopeptidase N